MAGASIEATLELWASSLRDVKARMRPLFTQERVAASAGAFLDGLLGNEQRKTGWMRAEAAGDPGPWRQQAILGRGRWEADAPARYRARLCASRRLLTMTRFWSSMKPDFSSRARPHAASRGSIPVRRARSRTVRSASSPVMSSGTAMPSSTVPLCAEGVDRRCGANEGGACAGGNGLCNQACPGGWHDRAGHRHGRAVCLCRRG